MAPFDRKAERTILRYMKIKQKEKEALLASLGAPPRYIALIGVLGAGKSTVGPLLAKRLKTGFVELDNEIEEAAGMPLADLFVTHGEDYYRTLEREALARLFATLRGGVFAP